VSELCVLSFRYRDESSDGKSDKGTRVSAHLYALVLHGGTVACVAYDVERGQTRAFAFDHMSELVASDTERFELPADFDVSDWLQGDFGVARAARTVRLLVEFDSRVADAVRARRVHPSQKVAVAGDGRVRASFSVPESPEVLAQVGAGSWASAPPRACSSRATWPTMSRWNCVVRRRGTLRSGRSLFSQAGATHE